MNIHIVFNKYRNRRDEPEHQLMRRLRVSVGTRINKNRFTRAVLRMSMINSRYEGYAVQEIAKAYQVSTRTAWETVKDVRNDPAKLGFRPALVKLYTRARFTLSWIRWRLRHKYGSTELMLDAIENGEEPP